MTDKRSLLDIDATGGDLLSGFVDELHELYHKLLADEKAELIKEFDQHKLVKQTSYHISAHSKVNDITQMLKRVENEVCTEILYVFI